MWQIVMDRAGGSESSASETVSGCIVGERSGVLANSPPVVTISESSTATSSSARTVISSGFRIQMRVRYGLKKYSLSSIIHHWRPVHPCRRKW